MALPGTTPKERNNYATHRTDNPCAALGLALSTSTTHGAEIGHYAPGLPNIRDLIVPLDVDVDLDIYVLAPAFLWVSPWKLLGAKYGAYITPAFANSSVGAALATVTGRGVDAETSTFAMGDLFVQPLWLGWTLTHWDFAFGYGFYAPVGKYDTSTVTLPGGATVTAESADNIGLGFWTHQLQGVVTWYPWAHKATAVVTALTYEIHGNKEDFDLTPGQNLT